MRHCVAGSYGASIPDETKWQEGRTAVTAGVRLKVLGGFGLSFDGEAAPALPRKTRALLAVLAVQDGQPMPREAVGELLWPGRGAEQVNHSLREALYQLRRPMRDRELVVSRDRGLVLGEAVVTDVAAFRRHAANDELPALRRAADAYGGPLLDGFPPVADDFEHWLTVRRAAMEDAALLVLARIGDLCTRAGDAAGAMEAAERMFAIDRLREETHARLLEACRAAGRRADGLRHYAAIVDVLRRELDVAPGQATRELARLLREEMAPAPRAPADVKPVEPVPAGMPPPVAVLPFQQLGGEPVPNHLADGIMVDVVCQLAGLRELRVISHGSTLGYRDPATDLRQVERDLGARYVVRGTMRRQGARLRLTTELADANSGIVVWARTHDTSASLDFTDQDRLVAQIVNTLAPRVHEQELRRIRGRRPESLTVYEKVLLAREHLASMQREPFEAARSLLEEVMQAAPDYGEALALMADCQARALTQGWLTNRGEVVANVEHLARRALELDGDNVRALTFHAHRRALMHRDYEAAMRLFDLALTQWPGAAGTWCWSSLTWAYVGETAEALRRIERARELSPRDREAHHFDSALCVAHYVAGDWDAAVEAGQRALADPRVVRATYRWTAGALVAAGRLAQAREMMNRAVRELPGQGVAQVVRNSPLRDEALRQAYGRHLLDAGFPA
jgi:TolB-like protein/DNA-binding SARP family transcriptional activator/Tfp pilus assembly protein PilF